MVKSLIKKGLVGLTALATIGSFAPANSNAEGISIGKKETPKLEKKLLETPKPDFPSLSLKDKTYSEFAFKEDEVKPNYPILKKKSSPNYILDGLQIAAGFVAQVGVHELGHYLGGKAVGTDIKFKSTNWYFKDNPSDGEKKITFASGFALPLAVSEILLDLPKVPKDDSFVIGLISGPIINNFLYVLTDATGIKGKENNDFEGMSKAGLKREITYPAILGISALQAYRLMKNPQFNDKLNFWVNPSKKGELAMGLTYKF